MHESLIGEIPENVKIKPEQGTNLPMTNSIKNNECPTVEEITSQFNQLPKFISAYDHTNLLNNSNNYVGRLKSEEKQLMDNRTKGLNEPNYTNYTPKWGLTLDYIFIEQSTLKPHNILALPKIEDLGEGLPNTNITASDHLLLSVDVH